MELKSDIIFIISFFFIKTYGQLVDSIDVSICLCLTENIHTNISLCLEILSFQCVSLASFEQPVI